MPGDGANFSMNPQMAKLKGSKAEAHGGAGDAHSVGDHSEPASGHHVFHKGGGKYHSVTHHADGSVEHKDHESLDEAHAHGKEAFKEGVGGEHDTTDGGGVGQPEAQEGAY